MVNILKLIASMLKFIVISYKNANAKNKKFKFKNFRNSILAP